jgi:hypothetical protein
MQAAYAALRDHARARGIEFRLTLEQFERFARATAYLEQTGPFAACLTVDRVDNLRGYVADNIQPLTRSANSVKRCKQDERRMQAGYAWRAAA